MQTRRVLAALSSARAAHGLSEFDRRDRFLASAQEHAGTDPGLLEATATVSADMLLDQGRAERALAVLAPLADGGARHLHTMRLLLRAHAALNHHDQMFSLARALVRRNALPRQEADQLIDASGAARLRAAAANDGWRAIWKDLKAEERLLPEIALAGAAAFEAAGEAAEAARVLEAAVAVKFNPALVAAYARCDASQVSRRLARAESWLQSRPTDPELLTALGMLCLNGQLWGQAERYLLRSVSRRNDARPTRCWAACTTASSVRPTPCATGAWRRPPAWRCRCWPPTPRCRPPTRVPILTAWTPRAAMRWASPTWTTRPARSPARPAAATVADYVLDPDARVSKEQHDRALAPEDARSPAAPATSTSISTARRCRRPLSDPCPRTRRRRPAAKPRPPRPLRARHQAAVQERRRALIISSDTHKVEP